MNKLFIPLIALLITSCTSNAEYNKRFADVDSIPRFTLEGFFTEDEQVIGCWRGLFPVDYVILRKNDSTYVLRNEQYINDSIEIELTKKIVKDEVRFYRKGDEKYGSFWQIREDGLYNIHERITRPLSFCKIISYKNVAPAPKEIIYTIPEPYTILGKWYKWVDEDMHYHIAYAKAHDGTYWQILYFTRGGEKVYKLTRKIVNGQARYYEGDMPYRRYTIIRKDGLYEYRENDNSFVSSMENARY